MHAGEGFGDGLVDAGVAPAHWRHVEPLVDTDVFEDAVAVDGAARPRQVDASGQHRLLQPDVGVGLVHGRHEQLDLLHGPPAVLGDEPADPAEFASRHVRQRSRGSAQVERLADGGDFHGSQPEVTAAG